MMSDISPFSPFFEAGGAGTFASNTDGSLSNYGSLSDYSSAAGRQYIRPTSNQICNYALSKVTRGLYYADPTKMPMVQSREVGQDHYQGYLPLLRRPNPVDHSVRELVRFEEFNFKRDSYIKVRIDKDKFDAALDTKFNEKTILRDILGYNCALYRYIERYTTPISLDLLEFTLEGISFIDGCNVAIIYLDYQRSLFNLLHFKPRFDSPIMKLHIDTITALETTFNYDSALFERKKSIAVPLASLISGDSDFLTYDGYKYTLPFNYLFPIY